MAEQAQKEPTMEEILSSIRKIIADDDDQPAGSEAAVSENVVEVNDTTEDAFDDLELTIEDEDPEVFPESEEEVLQAISQAETDNDVFDPINSFDDLAEDVALDPVEDSFESIEDSFEPIESLEEVEISSPEPIDQSPMAAESFEDIESALAAGSNEEFEPVEDIKLMATSPLAAASTADAAAGSLGKLLSTVTFGDEGGATNTIEGVVKELLRPMLTEWLDANLPGIVEKHVEAEVQRIARMAR